MGETRVGAGAALAEVSTCAVRRVAKVRGLGEGSAQGEGSTCAVRAG